MRLVTAGKARRRLESLNKKRGRQAGAVQREQQTKREKTSEQQGGNKPEQAPMEPSNRQARARTVDGARAACLRTLCRDVSGPGRPRSARGAAERVPPAVGLAAPGAARPLTAIHQGLRPWYRRATDGVVRGDDVCSNGVSAVRPGTSAAPILLPRNPVRARDVADWGFYDITDINILQMRRYMRCCHKIG